MGVAVLITAVFGTMTSTAAGMLGLGFCAAAIFITATTLIQQETPHELLGRVMSCLMSLVAGSQVLAMFVAGPVAEEGGDSEPLLWERGDARWNRDSRALQAAGDCKGQGGGGGLGL